MLKFVYNALTDIPEKHRDLYTERDGKFYLQVEGGVEASRLTEFRDKNTSLQANLESIVAKVTNRDPSEVKGIKFDVALADVDAAIIKAREDAVKAGKGDLDQIIKDRTQTMRDEHAAALKRSQDEAVGLKGELSNLKINQEVLKYAAEHGLRPTAQPDILARAGTTFKLEDGKVVAYTPDGKPMYDANSDPLTVQAWVAKQAKDAGHLFEPSAGGGAQNHGKPGAGGFTGVNPWEKGKENLTEQTRLYREDKPLAVKLASMHGIKLPE